MSAPITIKQALDMFLAHQVEKKKGDVQSKWSAIFTACRKVPQDIYVENLSVSLPDQVNCRDDGWIRLEIIAFLHYFAKTMDYYQCLEAVKKKPNDAIEAFIVYNERVGTNPITTNKMRSNWNQYWTDYFNQKKGSNVPPTKIQCNMQFPVISHQNNKSNYNYKYKPKNDNIGHKSMIPSAPPLQIKTGNNSSKEMNTSRFARIQPPTFDFPYTDQCKSPIDVASSTVTASTMNPSPNFWNIPPIPQIPQFYPIPINITPNDMQTPSLTPTLPPPISPSFDNKTELKKINNYVSKKEKKKKKDEKKKEIENIINSFDADCPNKTKTFCRKVMNFDLSENVDKIENGRFANICSTWIMESVDATNTLTHIATARGVVFPAAAQKKMHLGARAHTYDQIDPIDKNNEFFVKEKAEFRKCMKYLTEKYPKFIETQKKNLKNITFDDVENDKEEDEDSDLELKNSKNNKRNDKNNINNKGGDNTFIIEFENPPNSKSKRRLSICIGINDISLSSLSGSKRGFSEISNNQLSNKFPKSKKMRIQ